MYKRYAIYYTPERAFAEKGAAWLGWDIANGCSNVDMEFLFVRV